MTKMEFVEHEVITLSIQGAFQRANIYDTRCSDESKRKAVRDRLRRMLRDFRSQYVDRVSEEQHKINIEKIADDLSAEFKDMGTLDGDRFRIDIAQKALNLYLKYLWCLGQVACPPHCPFDAGVIRKLDLTEKDLQWTKLDSMKDYQALVDAAMRVKPADCPSSSEWELKIWEPDSDAD